MPQCIYVGLLPQWKRSCKSLPEWGRQQGEKCGKSAECSFSSFQNRCGKANIGALRDQKANTRHEDSLAIPAATPEACFQDREMPLKLYKEQCASGARSTMLLEVTARLEAAAAARLPPPATAQRAQRGGRTPAPESALQPATVQRMTRRTAAPAVAQRSLLSAIKRPELRSVLSGLTGLWQKNMQLSAADKVLLLRL